MVNGYLETVGRQAHSVWREHEIVISSEALDYPSPSALVSARRPDPVLGNPR